MRKLAAGVALVVLLVLSMAGAAQSMWAATAPQSDCSQISEIPAAECDALSALYTGANGAGWAQHTSWFANTTPCNWFGVTCNVGSHRHVTELRLSYNQLSGAIPSQLGDLSQLQYLALDTNQLTGSIPTQLGNLSQLQELYLYSNQLSGSIPSQLGNLSHLEEIYLNCNLLSGDLPQTLTNLTNLIVFYFDVYRVGVPGNAAFQAWLAGIQFAGAGSLACVRFLPTVSR